MTQQFVVSDSKAKEAHEQLQTLLRTLKGSMTGGAQVSGGSATFPIADPLYNKQPPGRGSNKRQKPLYETIASGKRQKRQMEMETEEQGTDLPTLSQTIPTDSIKSPPVTRRKGRPPK